MEKSIGLSSQFIVAMMLVAMFGAATVARGDTRAASSRTAHTASPAVVTTMKQLPQSTALVQHDDVLPTQNRTQAMALEAESGKLPQVEEDELKRRGLVKK